MDFVDFLWDRYELTREDYNELSEYDKEIIKKEFFKMR